MKIGIDARMYRSSTGGIGTFSQQLLKHLGQIDQQNQYLVFLTKEDMKEYKSPGKNFKVVEANFPHYSLAEQIQFPKLLKKHKLDLVHFFHFTHPIFYRGKYLISIHDLTMNKIKIGAQRSLIRNWAYHLVMKNAVQKSTLISVLTKTVKKDLLKEYSTKDNKVKVVPLAPDNRFKPQPEDTTSKVLEKHKINFPYILFACQWRPHKGIGYLIKGIKKLKKDYHFPKLKLVITGKPTGKFKQLDKHIIKASKKGVVFLPGFVADEDLAPLYAGAQAFAFPSLEEGFGLPPIEAMATGTPVASSNLSCMPEVQGKAALYFDPRDPADIALKLNTILTNQKLADQLVEKGYQQVKKYSWTNTAQQTLGLYQQIARIT